MRSMFSNIALVATIIGGLQLCTALSPEFCPRCPANECGFLTPEDQRYLCPNGNILDECGCVSSCQCAGCPHVNVSLSCPHGREYDANNCPLNRCAPDPCICPANECGFGTPPDQRYSCPHGNVVDNCGCVTSCQCKDCPWVDIHLSCPHGRKTDSNGCPLNECKSDQCVCPANECGFFAPADKRYTCPNGNVLDSCGCVSSCQCAGCPRINIDLSCPSGRKYASNGCPTDQCQPTLVIEKPGRCPQNGRPRNFVCTNDSSCPGTSKCCPYNGSRYCRPALIY